MLKKAAEVDIAEPSLPRHRKRPQHYEPGDATAHFPATVEDHYRQIYNEVLDYAVSTTKARFDQPGYAVYRQTEDLLVESVRGEDASSELDSVVDFYGDDLDRHHLASQLESLAAQFADQTREQLHLRDIVAYLKTFSPAE